MTRWLSTMTSPGSTTVPTMWRTAPEATTPTRGSRMCPQVKSKWSKLTMSAPKTSWSSTPASRTSTTQWFVDRVHIMVVMKTFTLTFSTEIIIRALTTFVTSAVNGTIASITNDTWMVMSLLFLWFLVFVVIFGDFCFVLGVRFSRRILIVMGIYRRMFTMIRIYRRLSTMIWTPMLSWMKKASSSWMRMPETWMTETPWTLLVFRFCQKKRR